jgi:hypothetical protein
MTYKQIMRYSNCRSLMSQDLKAAERRHHLASHHHHTAHHDAAHHHRPAHHHRS